MKKIVASLATGVIIASTSFMTVSADTYEVNQGDSLWSIAEEYNTTVQNLVDINELDSNVIQPNQKIDIDTNDVYVVQSGDTLNKIAKEFGVKVKQIKKWNDLDSNLIVVDQELEINGVNVSKDHSNNQANTQETEVKQETKQKQPEATKSAEQEPKQESKQESNNDGQAKPAKKASKSESTDNSPEGKTINVSATAYTANCSGCSGVTATGVDLNANPNAKVIAVDPSVIPLGSEVYVEGYGYATAADTGGAIKGNKIDLHVPSKGEAHDWGVRSVNVTIVK